MKPSTIERIHDTIKITQLGTNKLGICLVPLDNTRDVNHEYITESGTANPLDWLHPQEGGVVS